MSSSRRAAESLAERGDDALFAYFRSLQDAALIVDVNGHVAFVNDRFCEICGAEPASLGGRPVAELIDAGRNPAFFRELDALLVAEDGSAAGSRLSVTLDCADAAASSLDFSLTRVRVAGRSYVACAGRLPADPPGNDASGGLREDRLNEAQRIAQIGNWEWDILTNSDWWSDELFRMLEVDPAEQKPSFALVLGLVHPADRDRLQRETDETLATDKPFATEFRVLLPSGGEKVIHSQGIVHRDADGRPLRMTGTLQDVTYRIRAEAALRASESRYRDAQRIAKIGNFEWNVETNEHWWSDELFNILEEDPAECVASFESFARKVHPDDREALRTSRSDNLARGGWEGPQIYRLAFPDGREKVVETLIELRRDEHGAPIIAAGTIRDVTERHLLESRLRESEARYASTVELAATGIAHVEKSGRFVWVNQQFCRMLGYSREELTRLTYRDVSHPDDAGLTDADRARMHAGEIDSLVVDKRYVRKDGVVIWVRITSALRRHADGTPIYDISIVEDISDRKAAEQRIEFLATHDEMTGLPNRATFGELVTQATHSAHRHGRKCAVLFIDLDRFKIVNDSLGHDAGDALLREMTERIGRCVRKPDILARFGGDEFVVLLEDVGGREDAADVARRILSAVLQPVIVRGQECRVTASIGVSMFPEDSEDVKTLLKHADNAMYLAKDEGKNNFQFYAPGTSPMSVEHLVLESHLSRALDRQEFTIYYQTRVDVRTGRISGAEALLRWWNHDLGTVLPSQFVPLAEDTGLIVPIGRWVLGTACEQAVAWQRRGLPAIAISVNLSPRQFKDPDLIDDISRVLDRSGLAPELLELEITESAIMHWLDQAAERLKAIKRLGVRLAIDDFGTGYSSLAQLKRFPIDTLKVDRSFIRDIPDNREDEAIAEAIISLGQTLGVTVVAEGVENEMQYRFLGDRGCDQVQGYLFGRPCHEAALADLLRAEQQRDLRRQSLRP